MNLRSELAVLKSGSRDVTIVEYAALACRLAKQFEKVGEYEAAYEALAEFWPVREEPPSLEGLESDSKADLLLRVGVLAGWLGKATQTDGGQEMAKDLITRSIEMFEKLGRSERVIEGHTELALCYFREGSFDEARIHLAAALRDANGEDVDLKAVALIRAGEVEVAAGRLNEALRYYNEAAPLLDRSEDHALKGAFHNEFARLFRRFGREDSIDRALMEYTAASFHFEQAKNTRYLASVENNLGFLFFTIGKNEEAHKHLDRARHFFFALNDTGMIAQVDETRARTLLAENRLKEAKTFARLAVRTLEKGDERSLLAEALTTYGVVQARMGEYTQARNLFERAVTIAETAGDLEGAGKGKLSIIEELCGQTPAPELVLIYQSAAELLQRSQDPTTSNRLIICAQILLEAWKGGGIKGHVEEAKELSWAAFRREVTKAEKALIARALQEAEGSVTKASHLLGFKHHQSLISIINIRHPDLKETRSKIRKRRWHIFSRSRRTRRIPPKPSPVRRTSPIAILHVEDNAQVANLVVDMFAEKDWRIELCPEGETALLKLTGDEHYDLLIIDNDLPEMNGLELVQRVRKISHHRRTRIIMLSASDCETEAWRAGVDEFLKKPEQIDELPATVARLLKDAGKHV